MKIVEARERGERWVTIANFNNMRESSVRYIYQQYKKSGSVKSGLVGKRGKPKTSPTTDRKIIREVKKNPFTTRDKLREIAEAVGTPISKATITNRLKKAGLSGRKPRKVPYHRKMHLEARLKYANEHLDKPLAFWEDTLYTDETKIGKFHL